MTNPFLLNPRDRMRHWKELRQGLTSDLSDMQHLEIVSRYWATAPVKQPYMDYLDPGSWPDAWDMVHSCDFDQDMVSLGMFHTLLLAEDGRWDGRLSMMMIRRPAQSVERLVVLTETGAVLNYYHGIVAKWPMDGETKVLCRYRYDRRRRQAVQTDEITA